MIEIKCKNGARVEFNAVFWDKVLEANPGWTAEDDLGPKAVDFIRELQDMDTDEITPSKLLELSTKYFNVSMKITPE